VIKVIGMEGEIMPSIFGNYTGMNKNSLSRMIDDLKKKGWCFGKIILKTEEKCLFP